MGLFRVSRKSRSAGAGPVGRLAPSCVILKNILYLMCNSKKPSCGLLRLPMASYLLCYGFLCYGLASCGCLWRPMASYISHGFLLLCCGFLCLASYVMASYVTGFCGSHAEFVLQVSGVVLQFSPGAVNFNSHAITNKFGVALA